MVVLSNDCVRSISGGDSCNCMCWRASDKKEVSGGVVSGIDISIGIMFGTIPGSAIQMCRVQCHTRGMVLRRCI